MASTAWRKRVTSNKKLVWGGAVLAVVLFWLWRGTIYQAAEQAPEAAAGTSVPSPAVTVQVKNMHAGPYQPQLKVQGQLQALHHVVVRARTEGVVEQLAMLGQAVAEGDKLLTLSIDDRRASLRRAEAERTLRAAELQAAERLQQKGLIAATELLMRRSADAQAAAALTQARLALDDSRPIAPFAGTVDARHVEAGDYVVAGDALLTLVNADELKLTAYVPQQQIAGLKPGLPVTASSLDGRELAGTLTFVAVAADADTRSFAVEARFSNPQAWRLAGASAELNISLPVRPAHRLSPALLALDEQGRTGVYVVDTQNRLQLLPLTVLAITPDEAWVTGLPDQLRVVTRGAGFAGIGDAVIVQETAQ
ncbi:efflux RND transporter periplasmic adaptor subunit [Oceanimonas baumannii]|uniref:efflux RND transporter periplasmic adaptor subunit n=1 Tax=Oceanimonas baumannii TaxID=129578 RepID=UPI001D189E49|nr:efflux RND transporter periplasmic adaptor subunit [Oceanimonas baumannii]MCC4265637.1 efflux RND transporter periplasmic adaptor subunit [Oceanimonas baumannii]